MAFDDLHPVSKQYIEAMAANIEAGTHTADIIRYSGTVTEPRARIVQAAAGGGEGFTIWLEGYASGDAFNRLIAKGFIKGGWADAEVWEGAVEDSALETYRAG